MRNFRDLPIRRKLIVIGVAASGLALFVSGASLLISVFIGLRGGLWNELRVNGSIVADNLSAALAFDDRAIATETVGALHATPSVDVACVYDLKRELYASYRAPNTADCPAQPPSDGETIDNGLIIVRPVFYQIDRRLGTLFIRSNLTEVRRRFAAQVPAALVAMALGIAVAILLSARMQRFISEPIGDLSSTAAKISRAGDYSVRATKQGEDEIGQLVDTFNGMVAEIGRRDDQLRAASRLKDEFLAALSHELRTPLNAVLGWIQVLRVAPADAATTARAHESIERNARAQASLIEDLLDVSRIVTGKLHFTLEPVNLNTVIDAALEVVRPAADAKGITIHRELPASPQVITGDPNRLQQIFWNLLSNAVKFTGRNGHVDVSLRIDADTYRFEVKDDGIGIAPEFLPHVFDRFRQADGSLTRPQGGLGLGLSIARELTEMHGGRAEIASAGLGCGATFTVTLPRPATAPVTAAPADTGEMTLHGLSLLVVDDDEDARELSAAALGSAGAAVHAVASADEALLILAEGRTDVLLCDLAMPGTDGYRLLEMIRSGRDDAIRQVPAIAVSAHGRERSGACAGQRLSGVRRQAVPARVTLPGDSSGARPADHRRGFQRARSRPDGVESGRDCVTVRSSTSLPAFVLAAVIVLLTPLAWPVILAGLGPRCGRVAELFAGARTNARAPAVRYGRRARAAAMDPGFVIIGDSMAGRVHFDPPAISPASRSAPILQNATGSAYWYLAFRTSWCRGGVRSRSGRWCFRDTNLTDPMFRLSGAYRSTLDEVAQTARTSSTGSSPRAPPARGTRFTRSSTASTARSARGPGSSRTSRAGRRGWWPTPPGHRRC
jgi:signal transduction histidine kinase/CheY-like chemotaxis protein